METVTGTNFKRFREKGKEYQMVWECNTLCSPEGATVVAVSFARPPGKREIFRETGFEQELEMLKAKAEATIKADAAAS